MRDINKIKLELKEAKKSKIQSWIDEVSMKLDKAHEENEIEKLIIDKAIKICKADFMQYPDFDEDIELSLADALTIIVTHDEDHDTKMESDKVYDFIDSRLTV